jgi:hypothetical protein
MDFQQYSLEPVLQVVHSINDKLMTLTMDFDDMYLELRTTFANQDEVDEVLQEYFYYLYISLFINN